MSVSYQKNKNKQYSQQFIVDTVRIMLNENISVAKASRDFGVAQGTLYNWLSKFKSGVWSLDDIASVNKAKSKPIALTEEQKTIRAQAKQIRELTMERDILKKAMEFFANPPK